MQIEALFQRAQLGGQTRLFLAQRSQFVEAYSHFCHVVHFYRLI